MPTGAYEIEFDGDMAKITFYENVMEQAPEGDEPVEYVYDAYSINVRDRENLIATIDASTADWLKLAKETEYNTLANEIRAERDRLLAASDRYVLPDYPIADKNAALIYRQSLRDVPDQEGFPYQVVWPTL